MSDESINTTPNEADQLATETPQFRQLLQLALSEDIGTGDVTSTYFIPQNLTLRAFIVAREPGTVAGLAAARATFLEVDPDLEVQVMIPSGSSVAAGAHVLVVSGKARSILTAERTALNFIQRLSGVATLTSKFVDAVSETKARILDTRKTTPGYRALEKAAVLAGKGQNHRMGLYDRAMVKDNHIASLGGLEQLQSAINSLKAEKPGIEIEIEADSLEQVEKLLSLDGIDHILLDNMSNEMLTKAIELRGSRGRPLFEASGGVSLDTVRSIAVTGVDFISVGALTHSAGSLDLGLDTPD